MSRVVVDVSAAVNSKAGLGRYAASLVAHLRDTWVGPYLYLFYNRRPGGYLPLALRDIPHRRVSLGYKPWRMLVWMGHLAHVPFDALLPRDARLFHATEHLLPPLKGIPTVLTVHDLIFERFPQYHKRLNYLFLTRTMPLFTRRATAIIAISHATKRDLVNFYHVPEEKVHVIYEAPAPHFYPQPEERVEAARRQYGLPERYMLTVGTIEPRKNLVRLLEAFEGIYKERLADAWVIVGQRGWLYEGFFRRLEQSPARAGVILLGFVPDEDLPALYAGATVFVFPSLYEGFGLPVLEAMACGAPVVSANTGALPEVGGKAVRYIDPIRGETIYEALREVLEDADARRAMREAGFRQAAQFSWAKTARETAEVYRQVGGGRLSLK